jgi:hypothetical protein
MSYRCALLLCLLFATIGCGAESMHDSRSSASAETMFAPTPDDAAVGPSEERSEPEIDASTAQGVAAESTPANVGQQHTRKIVYRSDLSLRVASLTMAVQEMTNLVTQAGGFVAQSSLSGVVGNSRTGRWVVRIPAESFGKTLDSLAALGELERQSTNSQEVTAEFYDLEARIRNKTREEERLLEHLNASAPKLDDILRLEAELSRVRGEIEQMQGRKRVLADLTSLTTITINMVEAVEFVAAVEIPAPTFVSRIVETWTDAVGTLRNAAEAVVLLIVAAAPWLLVLGMPAWLTVRIFRRRRLSTASPS